MPDSELVLVRQVLQVALSRALYGKGRPPEGHLQIQMNTDMALINGLCMVAGHVKE